MYTVHKLEEDKKFTSIENLCFQEHHFYKILIGATKMRNVGLQCQIMDGHTNMC